MAVRQQFGELQAGAARGLELRHDHGSNFMSDHFQKQIKFWGVAPSFAFVAEPETNGVIERFFRTLKEQIIDGHIYLTIDEVRDAVRAFATRYNAEWLIAKNGYRSPTATRSAWVRVPVHPDHRFRSIVRFSRTWRAVVAQMNNQIRTKLSSH